MVGVSRTFHRCTKATDDADHGALVADDGADLIGGPETVLDGENWGIGLGYCERVARGRFDTVVLGRDDDEICIFDVAGVGGGIHPYGAITAGALHA